MPISSDLQELLVGQGIDITSEAYRQGARENIFAAQILDTPTDELARQFREQPTAQYSYQSHLAEDLAFNEEQTPDNDADPMDWLVYGKKVQRKREAALKQQFLQYQIQNPQKTAEMVEAVTKLGQQFNFDPKSLENIALDYASRKYEDTIDMFGALPREIMYDPVFRAATDEQTYAYAKSFYDMSLQRRYDGFFDKIGFAMDAGADLRELDLRKSRGELTLEEAALEGYALQSDLEALGGDDDAVMQVATMMNDIYNAAVDRPEVFFGTIASSALFQAAFNAGVGALVGGVGAAPGALSGLLIGAVRGIPLALMATGTVDTYYRELATIAYAAAEKNPQLTIQQALKMARPEAALAASIDLASDAFFGGVLSKGTMALVKKIGANAVKKTGKAEAADAIEKTITDKVKRNLTYAARDFIGIQISELSAEGAQGAVEQMGINRLAGNEDVMEGTWQAFTDNVKQAMGATMLLGALGVSPRAFSFLSDMTSSLGSLNETKKNIEEAVMAGETMKNAPPQMADVVNKLNPKTYLIKAQDLADELEERGMDVYSLPERFRNLNSVIGGDPEYTYYMNVAEYSQLLDTEAAKIIMPNARSEGMDMTPKQAAKTLKDIIGDGELGKKLEEDMKRISQINDQKASIRRHVFDRLVSEGVLNSEQADAMSSLVSNMFESLSRDTGVSLEELGNVYKLNIDKYRETLDVGNVQHHEMHPEANIGGTVLGEFSHGKKPWGVLFNKNADFHVVLHEFAHAYLQMLSDLDVRLNSGEEIKAPRIRQGLETLRTSLGMRADFNALSPQEQVKAHERFVSLFVQHYIKTGKEKGKDAPLVGQFRHWLLQSVRNLNLDMYRELKSQQADQKRRIKKWQEAHPEEMKAWRKDKSQPEPTGLPEGEVRLTDEEIYSRIVSDVTERQIGDKVPEYSEEFGRFVDAATLYSDLSASIADLYRGTDGVIATMMGFDVESNTATVQQRTARSSEQARPKLSEKDRQDLMDMRQEWYDTQYQAESALDDLALLNTRGVFDVHRKLSEIKQALSDLAKEGNPEWVTFLHGIEKEFDTTFKKKVASINENRAQPNIHALRPLVFNRDQMLNLLDEATYNRLERQNRLAPDGLTIEDLKNEYIQKTANNRTIAARIELSSVITGDDVRQLAEKQTIEAVHQKLLKDRVFTDEQIQAVAEFKSKMGVKAANLLNKMIGAQRITEKQLKAMAELAVRQMNYGDIDIKAWVRQIKQYEKQARRDMLEGKLDKAALNLQKSAALSQRIIVANGLKASIDKRAINLRKTFLSKTPATRKRYDQNTMVVGKALLSRMGLYDGHVAQVELEQAREYAPQVMEKYEVLLQDPRFDHYYKNMKINDMFDALDVLGGIRELADATAKMRYTEEVLSRQAAGDACAASIDASRRDNRTRAEAIADHRVEKVDGEYLKSTASDLPVARKIWNTWRYSIHKILPLCQEIDGSVNGAMTKYVYRPIRRAFDLYKSVVKNFAQDTRKVFDAFDTNLPESMNGIIKAEDYLGFNFGVNSKYRRNGKLELLGFMMHIGNDYNYRAIAEWVANACNIDVNLPKEERIRLGQERIQAFMDHMIKLGIMDKNFFDTLQGLWDINKGALKYAQEGHYQKTGTYFKEQENRAIRTPFGEYKGGYAPLKKSKDFDYNNQFGKDASKVEDEVLQSLPRTNSNFTVERTGRTGYPVDIDIEHIMRQVDDVVRYGVMQPVVDQVNTLLTHKAYGVSDALQATNMPDLYQKVFQPWLQRMCTGKPQAKFTNIAWIDQTMRALRNRTSAMVMFANLNNTVQGLTNLIAALNRVDSSHLLQGMAALFNPIETRNSIMVKSAFMRRRLEKQQMDFNNAMETVFMPADKLHGFVKVKGKMKAVQQWSLENSYFMQKFLQNQIDVVVWSGKYQEVIDNYKRQGRDITPDMEHEAVLQADEAIIATQGSFDIIDASNAEMSNPFAQLFVQFGNYFFTMADLMFSTLRIVNNPNDPRPLVWARQASVVMLTMIAPGIIADLINKTFTRGWDEDSEDDALFSPIMDSLCLAPLRMFLGSIPAGGQIGNTLMNEYLLDKNYYTDSFFNLPVVTIAQSGLEGAGRLLRGAAGEDVNWYRTWRDAGQFAALVTGVPMGAFAAKWASYMGNWYVGNIRPTDNVDATIGAITARPSPEAMK